MLGFISESLNCVERNFLKTFYLIFIQFYSFILFIQSFLKIFNIYKVLFFSFLRHMVSFLTDLAHAVWNLLRNYKKLTNLLGSVKFLKI